MISCPDLGLRWSPPASIFRRSGVLPGETPPPPIALSSGQPSSSKGHPVPPVQRGRYAFNPMSWAFGKTRRAAEPRAQARSDCFSNIGPASIP